jgi:hypothetical protein
VERPQERLQLVLVARRVSWQVLVPTRPEQVRRSAVLVALLPLRVVLVGIPPRLEPTTQGLVEP